MTCRRSRSASSPTSCRTTRTSSSTGTPCPTPRRTRRSSTRGSGSWPRPATARTPSGSAPTSARRRSATARDLLKQAGLPSDPQTLASQVDDLGRLHRLRQAVRGVEDQAVRLQLRRQRGEHLLHRRLPGRHGVRQRRRRDRRREQRRRGDRLGLRHARQPQDGITAGLQQFTARVEQGVLQRCVRRPRLPDLDDGLHPGPGRRRVRRQVGHRAGAARRRDQLGWLVARGPDEGQEPGRCHRAGRVAVDQGPAGHDVDRWRALPVQLRRGRRPCGEDRQERLLQQRSGGHDLR